MKNETNSLLSSLYIKKFDARMHIAEFVGHIFNIVHLHFLYVLLTLLKYINKEYFGKDV